MRSVPARTMLCASLVLLLFGFVSLATAQESHALEIIPAGGSFKGKISEHEFPGALGIRTADRSWGLRATGSGLRTKFRFKVYEGVLYVDLKTDPATPPEKIPGLHDRALRVAGGFPRASFIHGYDRVERGIGRRDPLQATVKKLDR